jgi:peroxiredoxin Q/BCP
MKVGDLAPPFEAPDESGTVVRLEDLLEAGPVVLFFYPGAFTPGCTAESCHFRDRNSELAAAGARVVGISADAVEKQARFAESYNLGFPLLSDRGSKIARAYGVKRLGLLPNARATFVIDTDRRVLAVVKNELNMNVHADTALDVLGARR